MISASGRTQLGRTGSRLSKVDHLTPSGELTTEYAYPAQGSAATQPHLLNGYTVKNSSGQTVKTASYTYDEAGNTKTRPGPSGQQTLRWDAEGHLESVSDTSGTTSYIYDGTGNRLLAKTASGATLYLGAMQVELSGTVRTATRWYSFNGGVVAQRSGAGIKWICSDLQGTSQVAVSADSAQTVTRRRQTPYGEARGTNPVWIDKKGFVGGDVDPTGLVHLGAREYDPDLGRFISADPIVDLSNPQQMHGYAYANNSPITFSDPSGLFWGNNCKTFLCGMVKGFLNALNIWEMAKALWSLLSDLGGAFKALKGEAEHWEEKTGNEVLGWVCALSGVCEMLDSCAITPDPYACGEAIGGALVDLLITAISAGAGGAAAGLVRKGVELAADLSKKLHIPNPHLKPGKHPDSPSGDHTPTTAPDKPAVGGGPDKPTKPTKDGGKGGGKGGSKCEHSFAAGTRVAMADGTTKPIEEVADGDQVVTTDPETGETTTKTVVETHRNLDTDLTDLTVVDAQTGERTVLLTTQNHPFWNETEGAWTNAADLTSGDRLRALNGALVVVAELRNHVGESVMRDLTVADIHTYYVLAGATPVLVHNCDTGGLSLSGARQVSGRFPKTADPGEILFRQKEDGTVTAYARYDADGAIAQRADLDPNSATHAHIPAPHILDMLKHTNPKTGQEYRTWAKLPRPLRPEEELCGCR